MSHDAESILREAWRVLAAGGRLLAVVPNRRGLWARMDTTPFGHGRPYSRPQITYLLRADLVHADRLVGGALRSADPAQLVPAFRARMGAHRRAISAPFAGVHIVEAMKQVYRAIPARREKRRLMPALEPVLAPSPGGAARTVRALILQKRMAGRAGHRMRSSSRSFSYSPTGPDGGHRPARLRPAADRGGGGGGGAAGTGPARRSQSRSDDGRRSGRPVKAAAARRR